MKCGCRQHLSNLLSLWHIFHQTSKGEEEGGIRGLKRVNIQVHSAADTLETVAGFGTSSALDYC